jgi:hypothetical protein
MSANSGPLKPGTLCWLTFTTAANIGKVVEVISLAGTFNLGDVYHVKAKESLTVQDLVVENNTGVSIIAGPHRPSGSAMMALRKQLIPMNDPDNKMSIEDWGIIQKMKEGEITQK